MNWVWNMLILNFLFDFIGTGFPEMKTNRVTDSEITSTIASLKSKNSSGYDGILKKKC